jgi:hypothetical protein
VLARSRKPDCARAETAPHIRSAASGRTGNAHRVTDKVNIPDLAQETAAANRHGWLRLRRGWRKWAAGRSRLAVILEKPSTEQVVLHKPRGLSPLIDQALGRLGKAGFKAARAVEHVASLQQ